MLNKFLSVLLMTSLLCANMALAKGKIQNEDVKTLTELQAAGGSISQLINDTKIYLTANGLNKQLSSAITAGDIGGGSGAVGTPQNLLQKFNPDAEKGNTTSWTNSGGTFTASSSSPADGTYSFSYVTTTSSQTVSSTAATIPALSYGKAAIVRFTYNTTNSDYVMQAYDGTNVIATTTLPSTSGYQYGALYFVMPTSGSVTFRLVSASAGTIKFDNVFMGENFQIGSAVNLTDWKTYTLSIGATTTPPGLGTVNYNKAYYRLVGDTLEIYYQLSFSGAGSAGSGDYLFPLPTGYTINFNKIQQPSNAFASSTEGAVGLAVVYNNGGAGNQLAPMVYNGTGSSTNLKIGQYSSANLYVGSGHLAFVGPNVQLMFFARVPVNEATASNTITPDSQAMSWSGYHANDCSFDYVGSSFASSASDSSCTFTTVDNTNFGSVTSALSSGNPIAGITFTPSRSGDYMVCASFNSNAISGSDQIYQLWNGTKAIDSNATNASDTVPFKLCGKMTVVGTTAQTVTIQGRTPNAATLRVGVAGATYPHTIFWQVYNVSQNLNSPVLLPPTPAVYYRYEGGNTYGTPTATSIRRYTTTVSSVDPNGWLTCTDSVANGLRCVANKKLLVTAQMCDINAGTTQSVGISVNTTQPGTSIFGITNTDRKAAAQAPANTVGCATGTFPVNVGDSIAPHGVSGGTDSGSSNSFTLTAISLVQ